VILLIFLLLPPLKGDLEITSGFGAPRDLRLHFGVDFSTQRREGIPVYAVDDGEIFRLKESYRGYGKAVYLRLKGGEIVVYAHLSRFRKDLDSIAYREQLRKKKYSIDLYLEEPISVRRGEIIGYSGKS